MARGRGLMAGVALERGVDGRHGHGLALVGEVGVGGDLLARGVAHGLEGHQRASAELGRVDVEGLLGGADLGARHEVGGGGGHGAAVGAVGVDHVELTLEGVGRARRESLVGDLVDEAGAGGRRHALLALGVREGGPDGNGPLVDGPHVEVDAVARDGHGEAHEAVTLVGLGPELLDGVGVIGKGTERVVDGRRIVGVAREPDAGCRVKLGVVYLAGRRVIGGVAGVRALGVRVPVRAGVDHAVLVGHDHVPLARGLAGDEEGDPRHARHGVLLGLDGGEVAADDLLLHGGVGAVGNRALLGDGEGLGPGGVEQVALGGRGLARRVGAVGQGVRGGLGRAVLAGGEGQHVLAGLVPGAIDLDGVRGVVADRDLCARERGVALGHGLVALGVDLGELGTAAHDVVGDREASSRVLLVERACPVSDGLYLRIAVVTRLDLPEVDVRVAHEIALGRLGLLDGEAANGKGNCPAVVVVPVVARDLAFIT